MKKTSRVLDEALAATTAYLCKCALSETCRGKMRGRDETPSALNKVFGKSVDFLICSASAATRFGRDRGPIAHHLLPGRRRGRISSISICGNRPSACASAGQESIRFSREKFTRVSASKAGYSITKSDECGRNTKVKCHSQAHLLSIAKTKFIHSFLLLKRRLMFHDPDFMLSNAYR